MTQIGTEKTANFYTLLHVEREINVATEPICFRFFLERNGTGETGTGQVSFTLRVSC